MLRTLLLSCILAAGAHLLPSEGTAARVASLTLSASATVLDQAIRAFHEGDTVYAHVTLEGTHPEGHGLEALWRRPDGEIQERSALRLVSGSGVARTYFWIRFNPEPGSLFTFRRIAGREEWTVQINLDGNPAESKDFVLWR